MQVTNKQKPSPSKYSRSEKDKRIQLQEILSSSNSYSLFLETYRDKVVPQKNRTIRLLGRKNAARIIHTLLGYEVQSSYKRIQCPDLVTARYLRLFSELGFHSIKIPYDPTLTAKLIPVFEETIGEIVQRIQQRFPADLRIQTYVTRKIYEIIRNRFSSL